MLTFQPLRGKTLRGCHYSVNSLSVIKSLPPVAVGAASHCRQCLIPPRQRGDLSEQTTALLYSPAPPMKCSQQLCKDSNICAMKAEMEKGAEHRADKQHTEVSSSEQMLEQNGIKECTADTGPEQLCGTHSYCCPVTPQHPVP